MKNKRIIVHVSEVPITKETGMGRVESYWKDSFQKAGITFLHIGPEEVGPLRHKAFFGYKAYKYFQALSIQPEAFLVHEPASGFFVNKGVKCFVESHGIERRYWEAQLKRSIPLDGKNAVTLKSKILFPLWRLTGCDKGLKHAEKLLVINSEDREYVKHRYNRVENDILLFRNGASFNNEIATSPKNSVFTVLFNGSWQARKGTHTLVKMASTLQKVGLKMHYLLIGTGKDAPSVLSDWPESLHQSVSVIPKFAPQEETGYLAKADLFVLPSYFEGQPLSLIQAMAAGKCCITTNCCGQRDIITDGVDGLLFSPGDFLQLAMIVRKCYFHQINVETIGMKARANAMNRNWETVADEVVDFVLNSFAPKTTRPLLQPA